MATDAREVTIYFPSVLAFGINDCGTTFEDELEPIVDQVLHAVHKLYVESGARNFLLFDVPPLERCPGGWFIPILHILRRGET
jgi:hypothetical protein